MIGASLAGVTSACQEQVRRANMARGLGASPRAVAMVDQLWERLFRFMADGYWNSELATILKQVNEDEELQALPKYPGHAPELQPVPPRQPIEQVGAAWGGRWEEGAFDPAPVYAGLHCPILCVWGERDTVLPLQESVERVEQALLNNNHPRFELQVLPETTHMLYLDSPEPAGLLKEVMHTLPAQRCADTRRARTNG